MAEAVYCWMPRGLTGLLVLGYNRTTVQTSLVTAQDRLLVPLILQTFGRLYTGDKDAFFVPGKNIFSHHHQRVNLFVA